MRRAVRRWVISPSLPSPVSALLALVPLRIVRRKAGPYYRPVGTFSTRIEVGDASARRFTTVDALVDTGATHTTLPRALLATLGIEPYRTARFRLADGTVQELALGRTWVRVGGGAELTQVAFGEEGMPALLGAITLEQLHLAVDPVQKRLLPSDPLPLLVHAA
jgi:predicted aspartyl protease